MEKARLLKEMKEKFGLTNEQLAERVRKSKTWVTRHLQMLKLDGAARHRVSQEMLNQMSG